MDNARMKLLINIIKYYNATHNEKIDIDKIKTYLSQ